MERLSRERTNQRTKLLIGKITKRLLVSSLPFFFFPPFFPCAPFFFSLPIDRSIEKNQVGDARKRDPFYPRYIYIIDGGRYGWQITRNGIES